MINPKNRKIKLAVTGSLITSMVLASAAYAAPASQNTGGVAALAVTNGQTVPTTMKLSFPDVPSTHWASKHILKLAALGIVEGEDTGYKPENEVSQQDVIIMAIRMMGLEPQVKSSTATTNLPFAEVRDDAKGYVAMAIEKGLIAMNEELASPVKWGSRAATREWVAKMIIRAIGKQDLAATSTGPSSFADASKFSASSLGYINAAVALKLVYGFEDNTFQPAGTVTRAQMATFLSRAEPYMETRSAKGYTGFLTQVDGSTWTLQDKNGQTKQIQMYPTAPVYNTGEDTRKLAIGDVKLYSEVYVVTDNNVGYFGEVLSDEVQLQSITGTVVSVDINALTVTVLIDGMESTYALATNVSILDKNGGGVSLGSLLVDSVIEMKKNTLIPSSKIQQILVKQVPVNKTVDGTFVAIDTQAKVIKIKEAVSGLEESYPITALTTVKLADKPFDPAGLYEGDTIRIDVKSGKANAVTVVKQLVELRDEGKIKIIDLNSMIINLQQPTGSGLSAYSLSSATQVVINGNPYATIKDLNVGDDVKVEVNGNVVDRIIVTASKVQSFSMATIFSYDATEKILTVKDEFGNFAVYPLSTKTKMLYDEMDVSLDNFSTYFVKGKRVNLSVTDKTLVSIQITTRLDGTLAQINTTSGEMTIRTSNNLIYTYKYVNPYIELAGKSSAAIADLKPGDSVRIGFNASQDQIVHVQVRTALIVQTISKDIPNQKITVRENDTTTAEYYLNAIPIVRNGQTALSMSDIPLDDWVEFDYIGRTLETIRLVNPIRGKVTAVDASQGKVTLTDYNNATQTITAGTNFQIKSGTTTYTTLESLKPEDRVQVVTDSKGKTMFVVLSGQTRVVSTYNAGTKEVAFQRSLLTEPYLYVLHDNAYVHQGTSVISPSFLAYGDTVQVYFLGGKIIEISK